MLKSIKHLVLVLSAIVFCVPALRAAVPDWMQEAAARPQKVYSVKTNAVVLFNERQITFTGPDTYIEHEKRVVRILRPEGREEGHLLVGLQKGEKLNSLRAWTIDHAGHDYELKEKDFREISPFDEELYRDIHYRVAQAPAADPGSVVAFEFDVQRHDWFNELDWFFQEDIPVQDSDLDITFPSGWEFKAFSTGTVNVPQIHVDGNRWRWSVHDLAGIEPEPMMPSLQSLCARMAVAYLVPGDHSVAVSSWNDLGLWYSGLISSRRTVTPEISEKTQELIAGKNDFDGKLRALTAFIQSQIRYVAIEIGIGGFQPHFADDIFRARYGDCKDKVTLLSTMLEQAGIHSHYVLIDSVQGIVSPTVPSPLFDHAIIAIELPKEVPDHSYDSVVIAKDGTRYIIFDPTDTYTSIGELRSDLQDSYGLLVTASKGELIHTPLLSPDLNTLSRTGHFRLNSDGELLGEIVETRSGDHAMEWRYSLGEANEQQRLHLFERHLSGSLQGFTLQKSDMEYLDKNQKNLVLTFKLAVPQYGKIRGPLILLRPRILGEESFSLENKPRQYPVELEGTSRETDTYEIEIPADYKVDDVPSPINIDMGFASYQSKFEVDGAKVRYWREFVIRKPHVAPDQAATLRHFEGMIGADEDANVVLMRAQ
jgi:uncharacterized protein DUF3857